GPGWRPRSGGDGLSVTGRSPEGRARLGDGGEGALAVAGLEVDRPDAVEHDLGLVAEADGVERRLLHAVVGGQPDDDHPLDALLLEQLVEAGRAGLAGRQVGHRERRVPVLATGALVDHVVDGVEVLVELRTPGAADAVDRPRPPVL